MPIDNSATNSLSSGSGTTLTRQPFTPSGVTYLTFGNWSIAPTNLTNIMDGNDSSATTEGFVGGAGGYRGYINLLFPEVYLNCYAEFKIGARKDSSWGNQKSNWLVEISQDNTNWAVGGGLFFTPLPATEQIVVGAISSLNGFKAVRFSCDDVGYGGSWLRVYSLNLYRLACS